MNKITNCIEFLLVDIASIKPSDFKKWYKKNKQYFDLFDLKFNNSRNYVKLAAFREESLKMFDKNNKKGIEIIKNFLTALQKLIKT